MLRLTVETGQPVRTLDGRAVGDVLDLSVRVGDDHPAVHRLAIGRRRIEHLVAWSEVATFEHSAVQLAITSTGPPLPADRPTPLEADELLLVRDVLDTQIVDVAGQRVQRVGDVLLARTGNGDLEVVAVDVGIGPVARRLGLRRWAEHRGEQAVDWRDLHLTSERGHRIQLAQPASALHRLDDAELAHLMAALSTEHAADVLATVEPARAAAALQASHREVGTRVALALEDDEAAPVLAELRPEQARHVRRLRSDRTVRRRFQRLRGWRRFRPPRARSGAARRREQAFLSEFDEQGLA
ncbi:MAG: magnesium transporter MgtE N-terminal domain-containing protein [Microthrixaceae bacterium]